MKVLVNLVKPLLSLAKSSKYPGIRFEARDDGTVIISAADEVAAVQVTTRDATDQWTPGIVAFDANAMTQLYCGDRYYVIDPDAKTVNGYPLPIARSPDVAIVIPDPDQQPATEVTFCPAKLAKLLGILSKLDMDAITMRTYVLEYGPLFMITYGNPDKKVTALLMGMN